MMKKSKQHQWEKEKSEHWWSAQRQSNVFFLLFLFFLPTQFGKHFWPTYTIVSGLRIDYLSPTIYASDIILLAFLVFYLFLVPFRLLLSSFLREILRWPFF